MASDTRDTSIKLARTSRGLQVACKPPFRQKKKKKKKKGRCASTSASRAAALKPRRVYPLRRGTGAWYRSTHRAHTNGFVECRDRGRQVSFQQQTSSLCVREKLNFLVSAKMSRKRPTAQPSFFSRLLKAAKRRTTL